MTEFVVETDGEDMEFITGLCDFLHDVFENEIDDGTTPAELLMAIGLVLSHMFGDGSDTIH